VFLDFAGHHDLLSANPVEEKVDPLKETKKVRVLLTTEEYSRLFNKSTISLERKTFSACWPMPVCGLRTG
jgi:hypothetical protein